MVLLGVPISDTTTITKIYLYDGIKNGSLITHSQRCHGQINHGLDQGQLILIVEECATNKVS